MAYAIFDVRSLFVVVPGGDQQEGQDARGRRIS